MLRRAWCPAIAAVVLLTTVAGHAFGSQAVPEKPAADVTAAASQAPTAPAVPKVQFTTPAGELLIQIKPEQAAIFEEMMAKLREGLTRTVDPLLKKQGAGLSVYRASEPFGASVLYVVRIQPTVPNAEYDLFELLQKTMTEEERKTPAAIADWQRYVGAFSAYYRVSLTPVDFASILEKLKKAAEAKLPEKK